VEEVRGRGAAIIINAPMLRIFEDLAEQAGARVQDMLIYQLGHLLKEFEGFKKTVYTEQ
jgi:hypothetical protein